MFTKTATIQPKNSNAANKQELRMKKAYADGCAAITNGLGKSATHEEFFDLVLAMADMICRGNGHLSQAEALNNAEVFSERLQLLVVQEEPKPTAAKATARLM